MVKDVLLCGGGLDSIAYLILFSHQKRQFEVVHTDYGQRAAASERRVCEYFCKKYGLTLHALTNKQIARYNEPENNQLFSGDISQNAYVDGRNLSLIMQAFEYGDNVLLGLADPGYKPFPDADEDFLRVANELFTRVFKNKTIEAPFLSTPRVELLRAAYVVDEELFEAFTCWTPNEKGEECGICRHCILKTKQKLLCLESL